MKISIVQPRLSYFSGGGERVPLESMIHLTKIIKDISFDLYTTKSVLPLSPDYERFKSIVRENNKINIYEIPIPKKFIHLYKIEPGTNRYRWDAESLFFNNLVYKYLDKNKPDLILSYYLPDCIVKPKGIPSLLYLLGYPTTESEYREAMMAQYDGLISISQNTVDQWNNRLTEKIDSRGILPQGLDLNAKPSLVPDFEDDLFHIIFAGRLIERKGIKTLLEAVKLIGNGIAKYKVHIFGIGPMLTEIQAYISDNHLEQSVVLEGFKSNLLDYIHSADLCVFPSHEGDGLMNVVLESMYYNGLVLTTKKNGNEEAITNNVNGFLVEPRSVLELKNKIIYIINNYSELSKIKKMAKQTITEKFTWKHHADIFSSICASIIDEKTT